ncbi:E3 ubiquitin-protein ligase rnf13 [Rhizophlyctis rosea]|uniref:RING-type E3 ubiquitin transferase n=1 Tax=Rhizophlyctis rosea TaxID=64517 RepID=A0AAD5X334_9FUNG|nr:E3 ubiquitin-protein ligase rnf13 [Rhizophlyctis rosea]
MPVPAAGKGNSFTWHSVVWPLLGLLFWACFGAWWFHRRIVARNRAIHDAEALELRAALEGAVVHPPAQKVKMVMQPEAVRALPVTVFQATPKKSLDAKRSASPSTSPLPPIPEDATSNPDKSDDVEIEQAPSPKSRKLSISNDEPIAEEEEDDEDMWNVCVICLENYVDGDQLRILPCGHMYHPGCIDPWLTTETAECPLCKAKAGATVARIIDDPATPAPPRPPSPHAAHNEYTPRASVETYRSGRSYRSQRDGSPPESGVQRVVIDTPLGTTIVSIMRMR